ncbi:phosphotransferase system, EIIB family protein, partial [Vibrio parahaemolyticus V-223/04]
VKNQICRNKIFLPSRPSKKSR